MDFIESICRDRWRRGEHFLNRDSNLAEHGANAFLWNFVACGGPDEVGGGELAEVVVEGERHFGVIEIRQRAKQVVGGG